MPELAEVSFQETRAIGAEIRLEQGSILSVSDSKILGALEEPSESKDPTDTWQASFLAMHPNRCGSLDGDDIHVKVTDTKISSFAGFVAYNGEEATSYLYTDNPAALSMCAVAVPGDSCPGPDMTCEPTTANSTDDAPDEPQFLDMTAEWLQDIDWVLFSTFLCRCGGCVAVA